MWKWLVLIPLILNTPHPASQSPRPFEPPPELTDEELRPPHHVLTPRNKKKYSEKALLPVGDELVVVLPVQLGTAYRWFRESPQNPTDQVIFARAFRWLRSPKDGELPKDLETGE